MGCKNKLIEHIANLIQYFQTQYIVDFRSFADIRLLIIKHIIFQKLLNMKKKIDSPNLIKYIGNSIKSVGGLMKPKKSYEKHNGIIKHQPSWMYRNE